MSKRLQILKNSLLKKEALFNSKLDEHFATVKQANGQPLNDKRNGPATLRKWERQNEALRAVKDGIARTAQAIEREEGLILEVDAMKATLPKAIVDRITDGRLNQWRKHPRMFFVPGVDKARITWNGKVIAHRYSSSVTDPVQWKLFAQAFNTLRADLIEEEKQATPPNT